MKDEYSTNMKENQINFMFKQVKEAYDYYKSIRTIEEMDEVFGNRWGDIGLEYSIYMNNLNGEPVKMQKFVDSYKDNLSAMAWLHYMNMYDNYKRINNIY